METAPVSRAFLEKLLLRLKSGDARSIHLNALPGNFARIDIYDLVNIDPSLHLKFLNTLLSQEVFSFAIHIDPQLVSQKEGDTKKILQRLVKKLNHIYYQEKEEQAEHGYTSFGFGYPLLIKRDPNNPDRILKAPLFIWYLDIEKDMRSNNTWIISRNEEQPVVFNEALKSHLETHEKIKTDELEAALEDVFLSERELLQSCKILSRQLNFPFEAESAIATLLPGTNKEAIENLTKQHPWLRFSGIFGLYKTQKQSIIKDVEELIKTAQELTDFSGHLSGIEDLTPVDLDPSQENILHAIKQKTRIVIQGPPGTGKSQSLTGLITTALLNGKKVLVVCEKRTALEVLYNNLSALGLKELCVLIEDVYADRKAIVGFVREKTENAEQENKRMRSIAYEETKSRFLSLQEEINHRLNFSKKIFFGDDSWSEIIVKSAALNESPVTANAAKQIPKHLSNKLFEFTYAEYAAIAKIIPEAQNLYKELDTRASLFSIFHPARLDNAADYKQAILDYKKWIDKLYFSVKSNLENPVYDRLKGWQHSLDIFLASFSDRRKQVLLQQQNDLDEIKELYIGLTCVLFDYAEFNPTTAESMQKALLYVEKLHQLFNQYAEHIESFDAYYNWEKFLYPQDEKKRTIAEALKLIGGIDWPKIFETWYLNEFILKTGLENGWLKTSEGYYRELKNNDTAIKQLLPPKILHQWNLLQKDMLAAKDTGQIKYLYNQRKNKQFETRNSLRKIVYADFDLFSTIFPVVLVNPVVSASILPLEQGLFDLVILDEASQLKVEETFSSVFRGKTQVISGDKHQMPPSNIFGSTVLFYSEAEDEHDLEHFLAESHSLLEYANDAGFPNHYLDFHYRSLHPDLIRFSNAAFYNSRLVPMPERSDYSPINFVAVDGTYADGMNPEEARRVVDHIYSLPAIDDVFPSVGVATFNIFQRDLVLDLLWEQAYADKEKLAKLESLLKKGLFVKNLENIQGDERDIMILTTTFGPDASGKFRQLFGPLTQEKGYQLLNVIITRAKKSVHIYSSVPEAVLLNFQQELQQKGNTGKAIFYAYLAYAKACSSGNTGQQEFILDTLQKNSKDKSVSRPVQEDALLAKHVFERIEKIFGHDVQFQYAFGGFILPVAILKDGKVILSIETDEPGRYTSEVAYRNKLHKEKILETYGIKTVHVWSYEWWQNRENIIENIRAALT